MAEKLEATGKSPCVLQETGTKESLGQTGPQNGKLPPLERLPEPWVAQCKEFLKALDRHRFRPENPAKVEPWDDAKAFLASFELVAEACHWPRDEWATRLLPALSGEAERAFSRLNARDREDYEKVKAAIFQEEANGMEALRQHFRQFRYQGVEDPRRIYGQLRERCHLWLKPERRSKEQILELLILEQFLAILPQEIWAGVKSWEADADPQTLMERYRGHPQESKTWEWQVPLDEVSRSSPGMAEMSESQIYEEVEEKVNKELDLLANRIMAPDHPNPVLPPEVQDMAEAGLMERSVPSNSATGCLGNTEWSTLNAMQGTMHWEVTQENSEDVSRLGFAISKPVPHMEQGEIVLHRDLENREAFPGSISDDWVPLKIKEEDCQSTQEPFSVPLEISQGEASLMAEMRKDRCGSQGQQGETPAGRWDEPTGVVDSRKDTTRRTQANTLLHTKGGKWYRCKIGLVTPPVTHSGYEGHLCGKRLAKHKRNTRPKVYLCSEHRESFGQWETFVRHQGTHTGEKPHQCPQCGKCFGQKETLTKHEKIHTEKKPLECPECEKTFRRRDFLVRHRRVHTGAKPYKCTVCGKSFSQKQVLLGHQMIHKREKRFTCQACGKGFTQRAILARHKKIHVGSKTGLVL